MKNILLLLLCSLLFSTPAFAQIGEANILKMIPLHKGGFYVLGKTQWQFVFPASTYMGSQMVGGGGGCLFADFYFLVRTDSAGQVMWVQHIQDTEDTDVFGNNANMCFNMAVDSADNLYVSGFTQYGLVVGAAPAILTDTTMSSRVEAFVAKISPTGNALWGRYLPLNNTTTFPGYMAGVATSGRYVYAAGRKTKPDSLLLYQLDAQTGELLRTRSFWSSVAGTDTLLTGKISPGAIGADAQGNSYIAGQSQWQVRAGSQLVFDAAPGTDQTPAKGDLLPFVLKCDSLLAPIWCHVAPSDTAVAGKITAWWQQIAVEKGRILVSGTAVGPRPLTFAPQQLLLPSPTTRKTLMVAAMDTSGAMQWVKGTAQSSGLDVRGVETALHPDTGDGLILGTIEDLSTGPDSISLSGAGLWTGNARYSLLARTTAQGDTGCMLPSSGAYLADVCYDARKQAWVLMGTSGQGPGGTFAHRWYLARWDSCSTLEQYVFANFNTPVGIDPAHSAAFTLAPNPASDAVLIRLPEAHLTASLTIEVVDVTGKTVLSQQPVTEAETSLSVAALPPGMYLIRLSSGNWRITRKLMVVR